MHIGRLYAEAFRNLDTLEWRPHRHFNLITGDNGQGKTNLLEALSVAAGLRSFRTAKLGDCVRFGADKATVAVARHAAERTKAGKLISVAGGGDTVAALNHAHVADDFTYVSTAGGAFLEWMEGKPLPGVEVLRIR